MNLNSSPLWRRLFPLILLGCPLGLLAAPALARTNLGNAALSDYFRAETARLARPCLADMHTLEDWQAQRETYRGQLFEMLGLAPLPERTDLQPAITGRIEHEQFAVEKLHFQSLPGLYVTANLYRPKEVSAPLPAILYVCGHGPVVSNKVSYGNKVAYQHHGAWFARNGYVCLIIDTVQLGEIQGLHHGTYREGMWWWNARGYTPAGVEAWNSIRALDYLATRPEVDANRFGVTGRSGGGAYSWWLAALDERVKAAAPVAGITDLENHVVDGAVEGHCDCMFFVNTHRWDYPLVAALVAPRPLLLVNTDSDSIFPLDGVLRVHDLAKRIYRLYGAADRFGLVIGPGPHKDTQNLQVPVFRWFNHHLKKSDELISMAAEKFFTPPQLRVFEQLPADAINTRIHERFVPPTPPPPVPATRADWQPQRDAWLEVLTTKVLGGWPTEPPALNVREQWSVKRDGLRFAAFDFTSQAQVVLRLYTVQRTAFSKPDRLVLTVLEAPSPARSQPAAPAAAASTFEPEMPMDFDHWLAVLGFGFAGELSQELLLQAARPPADGAGFQALKQYLEANHVALAYLAPRGVGLTAWSQEPKKQIQIRRRFMLLGQTLDGMRAWDIRRGLQAVRAIGGWDDRPLRLHARGFLAVDALYATLFEPGIEQLNLWRLPASHQTGPDYLNVLRWLDIPQAVAMAAERSAVNLHEAEPGGWDYPQAVARTLGPGGR